jgi:hypothetical protein
MKGSAAPLTQPQKYTHRIRSGQVTQKSILESNDSHRHAYTFTYTPPSPIPYSLRINESMVVSVVGFSHLIIPGIHLGPRYQEDGDHSCSTIVGCPVEGSVAVLTQPQRRDTQTLRRGNKDHQLKSGQVKYTRQ